MELIDFIVTTYVIVDDFVNKFYPPRHIRSRGFLPKLSDSEVITMEIVGEYLGCNSDKDIYQYFRRHWLGLFPDLPDRSNFVKQSAYLGVIKQEFFEYLNQGYERWMQIIDSMPIEICKFVRANRAQLFKGSASYGSWFGQTFFGYKLHLKINDFGMIQKFILAPANIHDIRLVDELLLNDIHCWVLADKGYRSEKLRDSLWQEKKIYLHTSIRRIDRPNSLLPKEMIRHLTGRRRLIETVAGQLEQHFFIKRISVRDIWHLMNRITRKILSHTFCVFLNLDLQRNPLKLKSLVA
jgi:hypothetical protein